MKQEADVQQVETAADGELAQQQWVRAVAPCGGHPQERHETARPLLLTITEAALALRIGRSKAYELIAAGELETVRIGRSRRVPWAAVEAFVERLQAEGSPGSGVTGRP